MHEFNEYIKWCKEKGYKPSNSDALQEYVAELWFYFLTYKCPPFNSNISYMLFK